MIEQSLLTVSLFKKNNVEYCMGLIKGDNINKWEFIKHDIGSQYYTRLTKADLALFKAEHFITALKITEKIDQAIQYKKRLEVELTECEIEEGGEPSAQINICKKEGV